MADENYWETCDIHAFTFEDEEDLSIAKSKLTNPESLHFVGFSEYAEKEATSPYSTGVADLLTPLKPSDYNVSFSNIKKDVKLLPLESKVQDEPAGHSSPRNTIKKMLLGQPYYLEQFKAKEDKIALLDAAIRSHDGNAITAVILFLKKTLKSSLFNQELVHRPEAISHYLSYLLLHQDYTELANKLSMLGKTEEAAILKYKLAVAVQNPDAKIKQLENCYNTHFHGDTTLEYFGSLIKEQISLLQRQLPVEEEDSRQEKEGSNPIFQKYPRSASLVNTPVITTLYYCCLYHYNIPENNFASPQAIRKHHHLTEKQFVWPALGALAKLQSWGNIDSLFQSKSWLGSMKKKCCIGFDKAVDVLYKAKAPKEVLNSYLKFVDNLEQRLKIAMKYKCHHVAIDTLILLRDRQGLECYKKSLVPHTSEYLYLQDALKASTVKWKN